jgi:mannose-6-phosphate isomerase-like protein (cupin superfamily)
MAGYTIKNLREIEDSAVKHGFSETQEARFARQDLDAEDTGISFHAVKPGKRQAFAHRHDEAEEIYVILSGSGRIKLDDEVVEVKPMDAVRISPPVARAVEAGPDGIELLAVGPHRDKDTEMVSDHWDDSDG